jgi:hypothetical protein
MPQLRAPSSDCNDIKHLPARQARRRKRVARPAAAAMQQFLMLISEWPALPTVVETYHQAG